MKIGEYSRYSYHFNQRKQEGKAVFAFFTSVFVLIFWGMYLLLPFIETFGGKLINEYEQNGVQVQEPTGHGALVLLWYVPIGITLFVSVIHAVYHLLILKDMKKENELTWLESFAGLIRYDKNIYDYLMMNAVIAITSIALPLLSLIPNDLSNGMRILLLYFITFLTLSTYGLRDSLFERKWTKALLKEEKKQQKEEAKKQKALEKEKQRKEKEKKQTVEKEALPTVSQLEQLINNSLKEKEYQLPHFKEQVETIIEEIRYFASHNWKTNVEDMHMIGRILKEEVPAVLATYDELDQESKEEYVGELKDCLEKIHVQLAARNKGRQNIKKLGAQKVIEILKNRY